MPGGFPPNRTCTFPCIRLSGKSRDLPVPLRHLSPTRAGELRTGPPTRGACAAFPRSDYYEDSVAIWLTPLRPSRVPTDRTFQADVGAPFASLTPGTRRRLDRSVQASTSFAGPTSRKLGRWGSGNPAFTLSASPCRQAVFTAQVSRTAKPAGLAGLASLLTCRVLRTQSESVVPRRTEAVALSDELAGPNVSSIIP